MRTEPGMIIEKMADQNKKQVPYWTLAYYIFSLALNIIRIVVTKTVNKKCFI